jgi:hypothetical protein
VEQRDLIAGQLLKIANASSRFRENHKCKERSHVYQLPNCKATLTSCSFRLFTAPQTRKERSGDLHFWNTQLGFNQLHIVTYRATQKLFIAPPFRQVFTQYWQPTEVSRHLHSFTRHRRPHSAAAAPAAEEQLQKMKQLLNFSVIFQFSTFMEEVEMALRPYSKPARYAATHRPRRTCAVLASQKRQEHSNVLFSTGAGKIRNAYEWEENEKLFPPNKIEAVPVLSAQWWKPKQADGWRASC